MQNEMVSARRVVHHLSGVALATTMRPAGGETVTYRYVWRNNAKRATLYGRLCRVLIRGGMNSALVEFEDGQREIVSRNALRKGAK